MPAYRDDVRGSPERAGSNLGKLIMKREVNATAMTTTKTLGACLGNDRRSEGDPQRAAFGDRFPRIAGHYVRETIAESRRCGSAAAGDH